MKTARPYLERFTLAATALCAMSAAAGVKYWNNPSFKDFDVGDYVQDGLVLNYDGIRNAGSDADHDASATTWVNLGTGGEAYDMALGGAASASSWTANGYVFAGDAYFKSASKQALPEYYEIETLVDANASDASGIGYIYTRVFADAWTSSDTAWNGSSIAVRPAMSQTVSGTTYTGSLVFNTHYYTNGRPMVPTSEATDYDYITALGDSKAAAIFTGLETPTAMPGYASAQSGSWNARSASYVYLGGHDSGSSVGEALTGTVKNFRYYSRILDADERAWNRVVDEARYFGCVGALPVTNAVVASNIPIVSGAEPAGCYAVDASGYSFTAPASKVVKGRNYTCTGHTLETSADGGATWGAATSSSALSVTVAETDCVRITWQWTPGDGLVAYDADDYVQDGLVLHYDGIRNAGSDADHDASATTWVNLGTGGEAYDMALGGAASASSWTTDGYLFAGDAYFKSASKQALPEYYEIETLVDAKAGDASGIGYIYTRVFADAWTSSDTAWNGSSIAVRPAWSQTVSGTTYTGSLVFNTHYYSNGRPVVPTSEATDYDYITALGDSKAAAIFTGLETPTAMPGYASAQSGSWNARSASYVYLGGHDSGSSVGEALKGTVKNFRYYSRILGDEERAWNRLVDEARYFTEPNVVVASTRTDVQANEADGEYSVSGSYTFTAPESATVAVNGREITYAPAGYAIQEWDDGAGVWGTATEFEGASYTYTVGVSPAKVRLLWRWKAVSGIRTAADYDVSDYVAGGLSFHLDGIRNAGAGAAHAEAPATWVNLGTFGTAGDATIRAGDAERVVNWTDKGYRFDGNTRFFATIPYTTTFTLQLCTDAVQNDQHNPDASHMYPFMADNNGFAVSTYDTRLYFRTQGNGAEYALGFGIDKESPIGYVTAMLDDATKTARVFPGTTSSGGGSKTYDSMSASTFTSLTLGGGGSSASQFWTGTINFFRYYDRILSDDELAQNRAVDTARYHGELSTTNVVVATKYGDVAGADEVLAEAVDAYKVEGAWTFSATSIKDAEGATVPVGRYSVEELADGEWTNKTIFNGASYTYTAGSSPATVRLTWIGPCRGITIILR